MICLEHYTELSQLPGKVAEERSGLLTDLAQLIAKERAETLRDMQMLIRSEREALFEGLSKGADRYGPILEQLAVAAAATRDAVAGLERLAASDVENVEDRVTIKRVKEIADRLAAAASATKDVVDGLKSLFSAELRGLASVDAMLASQVQRIFFYAAALVLLLGVVLYVVWRASHRPAN